MAQTNLINNALILIVGIVIGLILTRAFTMKKEGFATSGTCQNCGEIANVVCPPCKEPDMTKYILKSTIPPCPPQPDLSKYMLKTECPPVPDLSKYVLKSSIPKQQPVFLDCSKCSKPKGECPPCPRARCPEIKCPEPTKCAPCAPCPRSICPPTAVKCTTQDMPLQQVRPYLSPLDIGVFGK
jgi:hypothetical protein